MDFRTELPVQASAWKFGMKDPLLTLGSCFAQSIGQRLTDNKFQTMANPFGTVYHPFGIHKLLRYAAFNEYPQDHTYLLHQGIHFNYDFHSSLADSNKSSLQKQVHERIATAHYFLKDCRLVVLTYGTAWVYERNDTQEAVSNCHKMPSKGFTKRMVSVEEITESFKSAFKSLITFNPDIQFILTVSPVRHVKDTLPLNNVSKAVLRLACHQLSEKYEQVSYFPAYEIMMDDLRDYRFYESDLIHPTETATDYIWEKFLGCYCDPSTQSILRQWNEIRKAIAHRPFHAESDGHRRFLSETLKKLEDLDLHIDLKTEIQQLKEQLA